MEKKKWPEGVTIKISIGRILRERSTKRGRERKTDNQSIHNQDTSNHWLREGEKVKGRTGSVVC